MKKIKFLFIFFLSSQLIYSQCLNVNLSCNSSQITVSFEIEDCDSTPPYQYITFEQNGNTAHLYFYCQQQGSSIIANYVGPSDFCVENDSYTLYLPSFTGMQICHYNNPPQQHILFENTNIYPLNSNEDKYQEFDNFKIFPNPASDILNVSVLSSNDQIKIYNIEGKLIKISNDKEINVGNLNSGLYFVILNDKIKRTFIKK